MEPVEWGIGAYLLAAGAVCAVGMLGRKIYHLATDIPCRVKEQTLDANRHYVTRYHCDDGSDITITGAQKPPDSIPKP
jgi:hypothetical protein